MGHQGATTTPFFFDPTTLGDVAIKHGRRYATASPFPHAVVDGFLPDEVVAQILTEFPRPNDRDAPWQVFRGNYERKLALAADADMGPFTRQVLAQFNSASFVTFLETLTGIDGLIPDPHFVGGGLHQIEPGGYLKVHADFNRHRRLRLDRRLNVLVYLNQDWREDYGGSLQLWDRDMSQCVVSVLPIAGRCVIFSTTDTSYHGHPDPLTCPAGTTRKSLALYYYTNGPSTDGATSSHTTAFQDRPAERRRARRLARQLLPPVAAETGDRLRGWLKTRRPSPPTEPNRAH